MSLETEIFYIFVSVNRNCENTIIFSAFAHKVEASNKL